MVWNHAALNSCNLLDSMALHSSNLLDFESTHLFRYTLLDFPSVSFPAYLPFLSSRHQTTTVPHFQDGSRVTLSWPFSYISFSCFAFPGVLYWIFVCFFSAFLGIFILSSSNNNSNSHPIPFPSYPLLTLLIYFLFIWQFKSVNRIFCSINSDFLTPFHYPTLSPPYSRTNSDAHLPKIRIKLNLEYNYIYVKLLITQKLVINDKNIIISWMFVLA